MRITINLDDDLAPLVTHYAESRSISLGQAISQLIRRAIRATVPTRVVSGLHVVDLPCDSPRVSARHVRELQEGE